MCDGASGRCFLYCAIGGLVPTCVDPYFCAYYDPGTPRDGYCVLDPDAPPPFDAGAPPDAGTFDPDASLPMSTCVGPACPVSLSVGALGGCVVRQDGEPRCWGVDADGDLTGIFPPRGGPPSPDFLEGSTVPGFPATVRSMEVGDSMGAIVGTTAWLWGRFATREPTSDMNNLPRELAGAEGMAQLAIAQWHVCGLLSDGRVACFGRNTGGELGDGTLTTTLVPSPIPDLTGVVQVATGTSGAGGSSCALHSDGTVDCWGALPSGTATAPRRIAGAAPAIDLALGTSPAGADSHFHAVLRDGTLVGWGENRLSELGVATPSVVREPAPIPGLPRVVDVAAGSGHACALAIDGSVWCWGSNDLGQVGIRASSSCVGGAPCVRTPVLVPGISGGVALDAGGNRTCVLDVAGDVWCWGAGPLGDGSPATMASPTPTRVIFP